MIHGSTVINILVLPNTEISKLSYLPTHYSVCIIIYIFICIYIVLYNILVGYLSSIRLKTSPKKVWNGISYHCKLLFVLHSVKGSRRKWVVSIATVLHFNLRSYTSH